MLGDLWNLRPLDLDLAEPSNNLPISGAQGEVSPVTRSSAVLVACPAPLVALTENLPLCAAVTAGILRTARPSLNEIWMPGKAAVERTWPSRNQLTSGTGEPREEKRTTPVREPTDLYISDVIFQHLSRNSPACHHPQGQTPQNQIQNTFSLA